MAIGKMKKYKEMLMHPVLRPCLPETQWKTDSTTLRMLKSYSSVFIKPNHGTGGNGIIRVKRLGGKRYEVRCGSSKKVADIHGTLKAIKSFQTAKDRYLIQRGIELAKYRGRLFDVRIYMQKPEGNWIIAGMAARVGAPHKFVTNYHKGGHAESLQHVLMDLFEGNTEKVDACTQEIKSLSLTIAETVNKWHPIQQLGVDLGIDSNGQIWIIEANSHPGHKLFTQLSDRSMIDTILKNKRRMRS